MVGEKSCVPAGTCDQQLSRALIEMIADRLDTSQRHGGLPRPCLLHGVHRDVIDGIGVDGTAQYRSGVCAMRVKRTIITNLNLQSQMTPTVLTGEDGRHTVKSRSMYVSAFAIVNFGGVVPRYVICICVAAILFMHETTLLTELDW
jgi:hypothetical protein